MTDYVADFIKYFARLLPIMANPGQESEIRTYVLDSFLELGFKDVGLQIVNPTYKIHRMVLGSDDDAEYKRHASNLGLTYYGDESQPHFVFNAHLDHYFAGAITTKATIVNNWLVGDGQHILGADCKAGIALIYVLVKQLLSRPKPPSIDIFFDVCEEAGLVGALEFVEAKQYHQMPFWQSYRQNKSIYCYCFDGMYIPDMGNNLCVYVNRNSGLFLSKYYMSAEKQKVCDVIQERLKWRNLNKKERLLIGALNMLKINAAEHIYVEKYGSALIILNKILPTIMLPVGFVDCHTAKEKLYLPYISVVINAICGEN